MSLIEHAEREMKLAGLYDQDADYGGMIPEAVMALVKAHSEQGHSGGSHGLVLAIFNKIINYKTLTPIGSTPDEWFKHDYQAGGSDCWQNTRQSSVFSQDGGKTWYDIDDPEKTKKPFHSMSDDADELATDDCGHELVISMFDQHVRCAECLKIIVDNGGSGPVTGPLSCDEPPEPSKPREWWTEGLELYDHQDYLHEGDPEFFKVIERSAYDALLFNFNQLKGGHEIFEALSKSAIDKLKAENERLHKINPDLLDLRKDYKQLRQEAEVQLAINHALNISGQRLMVESQKLAEALEFYGDKKSWKSVTVEDTNRRFCIFTGADLEYFKDENQNSFCGKSAREAITNWQKYLEGE